MSESRLIHFNNLLWNKTASLFEEKDEIEVIVIISKSQRNKFPLKKEGKKKKLVFSMTIKHAILIKILRCFLRLHANYTFFLSFEKRERCEDICKRGSKTCLGRSFIPTIDTTFFIRLTNVRGNVHVLEFRFRLPISESNKISRNFCRSISCCNIHADSNPTILMWH